MGNSKERGRWLLGFRCWEAAPLWEGSSVPSLSAGAGICGQGRGSESPFSDLGSENRGPAGHRELDRSQLPR